MNRVPTGVRMSCSSIDYSADHCDPLPQCVGLLIVTEFDSA